jgi:PAS domain S-box-containing protein
MQDHEKTKEQLLEELAACRQRMAALERAETESHSDRQRVEAALEQERNLLHTLMDHLPDNIYFKDAASRFIRISKAMATQFGLGDPAEAVGKTDFDFFTDEHARQAMADEEEILRSGRGVVNKEEKETWPDGHTTWTLTTKMPLCDEQGRTVGTFGLSRDVTERRRAAEALQRAKEEAEAASRAKSTFLANTSHEIRTPLNAIMGMTELVLKSQLTPRQREFLATVRDSGEALLAVINDILDFSRIEAGKLVLERQTFDLRESLGDTMKSFAIAAAAQGLELACYIHPDVPRMVVGDYGRLRQIVVNLVGNAVKFTQQGEVILEVGLESPSGNGVPAAGGAAAGLSGSAGRQDVALHFTVSDTGMGIPEERRSAIFEMFEQADNSMTRRYGGAGLGLAIASRLAGLMQGRIWVQSEVGRGSEFHFTARLGLAEPEVVQAIPPDPVGLRGVRVLAVDDNATNRRLLAEILRGWRMVPATAAGAREALALIAQAHEAGEPYDLVLTDAHMPDVDGFTLVEQIRRDPSLGSIVVMMLTSGDRPEDMARCDQLGIAAYLLKPIKQSELLEAIELALGIAVPVNQRPPSDEHQRRRVGPLHILLVEDSLINQKLAVALLESEGHRVTVAHNGRQAIDALDHGGFDLVVMDVQMPEMDGMEATSRIRAKQRPTGSHTPILAMTAYALKGDRQRCLEAGMDGYIAKPIRADELFDAIEALFSSSGPPAACATAAAPEPPIVDWPNALSMAQGDPAILRAMVEAALEEIPRQMAAIRESVAGNRPADWRIPAHTLKGGLRYFTLGEAFAHAARLEELARANRTEDAATVLAALEGKIARLLPAFEDYLRSG